mmetsp:Transcript_94026/g.242924  ORF Transcript_94026/g.242924 Transcript_94026/m.242924 type:complete len:119 (-) Transcript_94026:52-408(-)
MALPVDCAADAPLLFGLGDEVLAFFFFVLGFLVFRAAKSLSLPRALPAGSPHGRPVAVKVSRHQVADASAKLVMSNSKPPIRMNPAAAEITPLSADLDLLGCTSDRVAAEGPSQLCVR